MSWDGVCDTYARWKCVDVDFSIVLLKDGRWALGAVRAGSLTAFPDKVYLPVEKNAPVALAQTAAIQAVDRMFTVRIGELAIARSTLRREERRSRKKPEPTTNEAEEKPR